MDEEFLEPHKSFNYFKQKNLQECEEFFDALVKKSGIDIEGNRETIKSINKTQEEIDSQSKVLSKNNSLKSFLIFLIVLFFLGALIVGLYGYFKKDEINPNLIFLFILIPIILIAGAIFFIVFINKKINPIIKNLNSKLVELNKTKEKLIADAFVQMKPLNDLYDWNIPIKIMNKTLPVIELDPVFNNNRYQMLHDKYGFEGNKSNKVSALMLQSGTILGNPFLLQKNFVQEMGTQRYSGSLVIHWTTRESDGKGHYYTVHHSETLRAYVTKPKPIYFTDTTLIYGNDAASKLSFSRQPVDEKINNDKQLDRCLKNFDKYLDKLTQKSISQNNAFQRMSNTEFECFFRALDRDNNVEYRLLFTPLAQKNMLSLLRSTEPYGDDFSFRKDKCLNYISSRHSQTFDYSGDPNAFKNFDYDKAKENFVIYNQSFFTALYYDLAPLMSIPLYQQTKSFEYIYKGTFKRNVTSLETEVLANTYSDKEFKDPASATPAILKTDLISKNGKADLNTIYAYSFKIVQRIEYVSTFGGDGRYHNVPVQWDEYVPIVKTTELTVQECQTTKPKFDSCYRNGLLDSFLSQYVTKNGIIYKKGLVSFLTRNASSQYDGEELNKIVTNKEE